MIAPRTKAGKALLDKVELDNPDVMLYGILAIEDEAAGVRLAPAAAVDVEARLAAWVRHVFSPYVPAHWMDDMLPGLIADLVAALPPGPSVADFAARVRARVTDEVPWTGDDRMVAVRRAVLAILDAEAASVGSAGSGGTGG